MTRYLIDNDDDGHWYLMPEADQEAFSAYVYDEGPEVPSVVRLAGHPNNVTFESPLEFGKPIVADQPSLVEAAWHWLWLMPDLNERLAGMPAAYRQAVDEAVHHVLQARRDGFQHPDEAS